MTSTAAPKKAPPEKSDAEETTPIDVQIAQLRAAMTTMLHAGNGEGVITTLLEVIAAQHHDIARLTKFAKAVQRARFGRRSEKLTAEELGQLALALGSTPEEAAQLEPVVPGTEVSEENASNEPNPKNPPRKGSKKGRHPGRTALNPDLPRRVTYYPVPDGERTCIHCQAPMQVIGHVDHECVQYHPARLEVDVARCEKIACTECHQDIVTAPRPGVQAKATDARTRTANAPADRASNTDTPGGVGPAAADDVTPADRASNTDTPADRASNTDTPGDVGSAAADEAVAANQADATDTPVAEAVSTKADGTPIAPGAHVYRRAGASLLAHLLEAKADDALPIYRQRQQLARLGFDVPLNTLYGYWDAAARILQPVAQVVLSEVLGHEIVGLDDTRLDWLNPKLKGQRKRGHLWCFMGIGPLVAFEFTETWTADDVAPWIESIDGFIQCDDYKGYSSLRRQEDGSKHPLVPPDRRLGCWMHVRRPFHKAFKSGEKHAVIALGHIKELYAIEREARQRNLGPPERLELRQQRSQPIAEEFFRWVEQQKDVVRPASYLGQAVNYALDQKDFVLRCLTDGRFELDTGRVERQIREPVIGRKNYLFSGSAEAAKRLAGVYTLVCSCQNMGINTRAYLTDVINRLQAGFPLRQINRLRPDVWATEHPSLTAHQMGQQPLK